MRVNSFVPLEEMFNNSIVDNKSTEKTESNFGNVFKDALNEINNQQLLADESTEAFIKGEDIDISEVMLNAAEASMSLQFAVQVRNKLVEAYQEVTRMQI